MVFWGSEVVVRVLVANKFWYRRGGVERVMFDEIEWLEAAGHQVAHFSTAHPMNQPSPWSDYFAPYLELGVDGRLSASEKALAAARLFYNREAARRFTRLLDDFRPDVVHVHNIHRHISPSIVMVAHRKGVPVVHTLHEYHAVCPSDLLLRDDLSVCQPPRCGGANYLPCVRYRCVRGSLTGSALSALETYWRNRVLNYPALVDAFISPSAFLASVLDKNGWRGRPVRVLPNAVPVGEVGEAGDYFVYAGRLSREKGVPAAIAAAAQAGVELVVAGEGPLGERLRATAPANVRFTGRLPGEQVDELLRHALAAVVPSESLETFGLAALEAMAVGRPVIAARIGAIPELVRDGVDGILVEPGDAGGFAQALRRLHADRSTADSMGAAARQRVSEAFSPAMHLEGLLATYQAVRR